MRLFFLIFLILIISPIQAQPSPIKIGFIGPLSGPYQDYGASIRNGIELYRRENPEMAKLAQFIYEDDQYDPKSSITAYRKLVDVHKVNLLFSFGSTSCASLMPLLEKENRLLLNLNADETLAKNSKHVIRTINYSKQYAKKLYEYLKSIAQSDFATIHVETSYAKSMAEAFKTNLSKEDLLLDLGGVAPSQTDFKSLLLKVKLRGISNMGIFLSPDQTLLFLKQAKELGIKFSVFGSNILESALKLPNSSDLEGAIYGSNYLDESFVSAFKKENNNTSQLVYGGNAYDMTRVIYELLRENPNLNEDDLNTALRGISGRKGVLGDFSYVEDREGGRYFSYPIVIKTIKNGKTVVASEWN